MHRTTILTLAVKIYCGSALNLFPPLLPCHTSLSFVSLPAPPPAYWTHSLDYRTRVSWSVKESHRHNKKLSNHSESARLRSLCPSRSSTLVPNESSTCCQQIIITERPVSHSFQLIVQYWPTFLFQQRYLPLTHSFSVTSANITRDQRRSWIVKLPNLAK